MACVKVFFVSAARGRPRAHAADAVWTPKSFSDSILYVMDNNTCSRAYCNSRVCIDDPLILENFFSVQDPEFIIEMFRFAVRRPNTLSSGQLLFYFKR